MAIAYLMYIDGEPVMGIADGSGQSRFTEAAIDVPSARDAATYIAQDLTAALVNKGYDIEITPKAYAPLYSPNPPGVTTPMVLFGNTDPAELLILRIVAQGQTVTLPAMTMSQLSDYIKSATDLPWIDSPKESPENTLYLSIVVSNIPVYFQLASANATITISADYGNSTIASDWSDEFNAVVTSGTLFQSLKRLSWSSVIWPYQFSATGDFEEIFIPQSYPSSQTIQTENMGVQNQQRNVLNLFIDNAATLKKHNGVYTSTMGTNRNIESFFKPWDEMVIRDINAQTPRVQDIVSDSADLGTNYLREWEFVPTNYWRVVIQPGDLFFCMVNATNSWSEGIRANFGSSMYANGQYIYYGDGSPVGWLDSSIGRLYISNSSVTACVNLGTEPIELIVPIIGVSVTSFDLLYRLEQYTRPLNQCFHFIEAGSKSNGDTLDIAYVDMKPVTSASGYEDTGNQRRAYVRFTATQTGNLKVTYPGWNNNYSYLYRDANGVFPEDYVLTGPMSYYYNTTYPVTAGHQYILEVSPAGSNDITMLWQYS